MLGSPVMTALDHLRSRLGERYHIERELGRGGMGAVYLARDLRLDRPVALKVLPAEYSALPALHERFVRETRTAASFSHPNIVPVYAVEEADDLLAYAMGFIEGETLAERIHRSGPLNARDTVKLLQDVAYALAYAHGRGVVHRDIKPDNIMIDRATGRALVMDFGIARPIASAPASHAGLTRVGEVVGTPEYMSPEQATGEAVDGRSDIYALGLTAHFALTGRPPITGETTGRILARQIAESLPSIGESRPDLPTALAAAIDRCVAKDADARFPSAEALVEELDAAQLAAPEIPLPVRLFAHEAGTLSLVVIGSGILSFFLITSAARQGWTNIDVLLPAAGLLAIAITRTMQTFREARRLGAAGFSAAEVHRGLSAVMGERASRRAELRADASTRRARRRTVGWAVVMLVLAVVFYRSALAFRTQVGPRSFEVAPAGVVFIFSGVMLLGMGLVLLLRSPYRMPVGERLFRVVWLGPIGLGFLRLSGRNADGRSAASGRFRSGARFSSPAVFSHVQPGLIPNTHGDESTGARIAELEERVSALEQRSGLARSLDN